MRESYMQRRVREKIYELYTRDQVRILKLSTLAMYGEAGWPDLSFWIKGGFVFLIEMKAPGKKLNPNQVQRHQELAQLGFDVSLHDDIDSAVTYAKHVIEWRLRR